MNRFSLAPGLLAALLLTGCGVTTQYVTTLDGQLDAADLTRFDVDVGAGELWVVGSDTATGIEVSMEVWRAMGPWGAGECDLDDLDIRLEDLGGGHGRLVVHVPERVPNYWVDVTVTLPSSLDLVVDDGTGDLQIQDVASLVLDDATGDAVVERVAGDVDVDDGTGDLRISDLGGHLLVRDDTGDLVVERVLGDVDVDDGTGSTRITQVGGSVGIVDGTGDIVVEEVEGDVDIVDESGDIRVHRVDGMVTISDGIGDIYVSDVGGLEILSDSTGDVITQ